jgi:glycosyltransferase involved in cell wall biosynthesis
VNSAPTFSVVTITLRDLPGLKRTVQSVRAQRYEGHVEHIIIDGGSGSEVVDYLSKYKPAYWQSKPDAGRYDALNQGISHVTGDIIWFMDGGDRFSDPDAIAAVAEAISGHGPPEDLWGYAQANRVTSDGRILGVWDSIPFDLVKFATARLPIPHQASFFGTSLCQQLGGYDETFDPLAADQLFILRAAFLREPVTVPRVVCDFDATGAGSTMSIKEIFDNFRRGYDLLGYYPLGGRRKSLAYLRYQEYRWRAIYPVLRAREAVRRRLGHQVTT